jgi:hypothetical protein
VPRTGGTVTNGAGRGDLAGATSNPDLGPLTMSAGTCRCMRLDGIAGQDHKGHRGFGRTTGFAGGITNVRNG